jgi:hypothetical protein
MSGLRRLLFSIVIASLVLSACNAQNSAPGAQMAPRAFIPALGNDKPTNATAIAPKRVLFLQGDHIPENGYPHSRVRDDGSKPESFSRLRTEVLERDLGLTVDELVLDATTSFDAQKLGQYDVVVLGSNSRVFTAAEVKTLTDYFMNGGSVLTYADFQYGPTNWDSDNSFLKQFGIEVMPDNFQPTVDITDIVTAHPIMAGVKTIRGEGISQFRVSASALVQHMVIAKCSPLSRSGCILPPEDKTKLVDGDVVACVVVRRNVKGGRLATVCDRNIFHNGPGVGSDLDQADDRVFARNLFRWLSKQ